MSEIKLYNVSDEYINYLREDFPFVYSNKEESRRHKRKYLGVVIKLSGFLYYIPMSSPKDADYKIVNGKKMIRKSIIPIIRIVEELQGGRKALRGTLRISNMIPVPASELELYDLENESDGNYKSLIEKELIYIRKNKKKIWDYANILYKQKLNGNERESGRQIGYLKAVLDFRKLEEKCLEYTRCQRRSVTSGRQP